MPYLPANGGKLMEQHLGRLAKFKRLIPCYADAQEIGVVAALVMHQDIARYAYRKGLSVLAQRGENMQILNNLRLRPRIW